MSHDLEIANLETFANADGLNPVQRALLKQAAQRLEWCDEKIFNAEQRNRELTRQVEQLRAVLRGIAGTQCDFFVGGVGECYRRGLPREGRNPCYPCVANAALTAPPSSAPTDPGRADTGREER